MVRTLNPQRLAAGLAVLLVACATPPAPPVALGDSPATAIEVCKPPGERAWLARLQCPDGSTPTYQRLGNSGLRNPAPADLTEPQKAALTELMFSGRTLPPGQADLHIVDVYELRCGPRISRLYMDMYHCQTPPPSQAPAGFTLRPAGDGAAR